MGTTMGIRKVLERFIGGTFRAAAAPLGLDGLDLPTRFKKPKPGSVAGIELEELASMPSSQEPARITCMDYSTERAGSQEVSEIGAFLAEHRPEWTAVRWINVDGITDMRVIEALSKKYQLHPLAVEDLLHIPQRPRADAYGGGPGELQARLFILTRMIELKEGRLQSEQISIFLGHNTVLTFQETRGDVWDAIRSRILTKGSRLRQNDASFLVYSLLDAIIDHIFPILEHYGDRLEDLEEWVLARPDRAALREIHRVKRELLLLRRAVWPMREMVHSLARETHECLSENTRTYLRDVYDHTVQIIDILETYREVAIGLTETYMTAMSNRLNEVMKVLTMISVIFIPMTFLSGVFGMNFQAFPWHWRYAFPVFALCCLALGLGMLTVFRKRGWM